MLVDNMKIPENVDFCVVANKSPSSSFKHKVIQTNLNSNYIGFLKYFPELPDYEQYLYLDSDILFFGSPLELISTTTNFSVVAEGKLRDDWHSVHIPNRQTIPDIPGINAGTFAFKDKKFLTEMNKLIESQYNPDYDMGKNAQLEQSIFNFLIGEKCNFNWAEFTQLTDITKQHVSGDFEYNPNIQIYHFCGWSGNMLGKYQKMTNFLNNNRHILNK